MSILETLGDLKSELVTVVITSCGRHDCLKKTIESFNRFNTFPVKEFIIVEDSGNKGMRNFIKGSWPDYTLIFNEKNIGLVDSIDKAYEQVATPYIFHCENDWEFYNLGFIEKSLEILLAYPEIMQVWIRDPSDTNGHPIHPKKHKINDVEFKLVATNINGWSGFTWNPGLRRLSDYLKVAPFGNIAPEYGKKAGYREMYIGQEYYKLGYRAVILPEGYCKHIGYVSKDYSLT
jgi:hypothetical protein